MHFPLLLFILLSSMCPTFSSDPLTKLINRQWTSFWNAHTDPGHMTLYALLVASSLKQSRHISILSDLSLDPLPKFLAKNKLLPRNVSQAKFEATLKRVLEGQPFKQYLGDVGRCEALKFYGKPVSIPSHLQSLFSKLPNQPTYGDVFDRFACAFIESAHCSASLPIGPCKTNPAQRRAELIVSTLVHFEKVLHFVMDQGKGDLAFAVKYGANGSIDQKKYNSWRKQRQAKYLMMEKFKTCGALTLATFLFGFSWFVRSRQTLLNPTIEYQSALIAVTRTEPSDAVQFWTVLFALVLFILVPMIVCLSMGKNRLESQNQSNSTVSHVKQGED